MKLTYILRINYDRERNNKKTVSNILGVDPNPTHPNNYWEYEIVDKDSDTPVYYVDIFLSILEGKYEKLYASGIQPEDITVWIYYEYDEQCNMEFSPEEMKRLGDNKITLCVSCWESYSKDE